MESRKSGFVTSLSILDDSTWLPRADSVGSSDELGGDMARYLWQASYTPEGIRGLLSEGGTSRSEAIERITVEELGGVVEAFYFGFGEHDVYVIADVPDQETAAAISLAVGASGAVNVRTTVLLTPEQIDSACRKSVAYRPPGAPLETDSVPRSS
jgi:uncharacterized protein with GYD domain